MVCVWKLKGPPGLAGVMATAAAPSAEAKSDILLDGRRGETTKSGLRKARSISFQLLCERELAELARDEGRSRSRSMMSSSWGSSGGSTKREGLRRMGGRLSDRPEAMSSAVWGSRRTQGEGRVGGVSFCRSAHSLTACGLGCGPVASGVHQIITVLGRWPPGLMD